MSESNGKSQNLTIRQQKALAELLHGATVTAAAEAAGVRRETVHAWLLQPAFLSEMEANRERLYREQQTRILTLTTKAIGVVEKSLDNGDAKVALDILKLVYRSRSEIDLTVHKTDTELDAAIEREIALLRSASHSDRHNDAVKRRVESTL